MGLKSRTYIRTLGSLQEIIETYQQIASMRMRKSKDFVLQNRDFYGPLRDVYQDIKEGYLRTHSKIYMKKKNGRGIALLVTSNTGLYGDMNRKVFELFLKNEVNGPRDLAVTGRVGKIWMDITPNTRSYRYFPLNEYANESEEFLKEMYDFMSEYSEILVYHGLFKSILEQVPQVTKIRQDYESEATEQRTYTSYILEPDPETLLESLEKRLSGSLFDHVILESTLAKLGSRMVALDFANNNIKKNISRARLSGLIEKHSEQNKKQQELARASFVKKHLW